MIVRAIPNELPAKTALSLAVHNSVSIPNTMVRVQPSVKGVTTKDGGSIDQSTEYNRWLQEHSHLSELKLMATIVPEGVTVTAESFKKNVAAIREQSLERSARSMRQRKIAMAGEYRPKIHKNSGLPEYSMSSDISRRHHLVVAVRKEWVKRGLSVVIQSTAKAEIKVDEPVITTPCPQGHKLAITPISKAPAVPVIDKEIHSRIVNTYLARMNARLHNRKKHAIQLKHDGMLCIDIGGNLMQRVSAPLFDPSIDRHGHALYGTEDNPITLGLEYLGASVQDIEDCPSWIKPAVWETMRQDDKVETLNLDAFEYMDHTDDDSGSITEQVYGSDIGYVAPTVRKAQDYSDCVVVNGKRHHVMPDVAPHFMSDIVPVTRGLRGRRMTRRSKGFGFSAIDMFVASRMWGGGGEYELQTWLARHEVLNHTSDSLVGPAIHRSLAKLECKARKEDRYNLWLGMKADAARVSKVRHPLPAGCLPPSVPTLIEEVGLLDSKESEALTQRISDAVASIDVPVVPHGYVTTSSGIAVPDEHTLTASNEVLKTRDIGWIIKYCNQLAEEIVGIQSGEYASTPEIYAALLTELKRSNEYLKSLYCKEGTRYAMSVPTITVTAASARLWDAITNRYDELVSNTLSRVLV